MNFDEQIAIEKARENKVVKDNRLIQNVTRRKYELSVLEQKILGFIISLIKPPENITSEPQYKYEFDIRTFCKVCGIDCDNGKNYVNVKEALRKIADNSFWIDEGESELYFQWINTPRINKKSGKITIRISDEVMPYLWNLQERFTAYELYQILALKSSHSIAIYELLKSHAFKKKIIVGIDDLKKYLNVESKYKDYKDFRRKVIEQAIGEINQYTDLNISWNPIRNGRFYVAIEFNIAQKEQWAGYEAYRATMAAVNGVEHAKGQLNLFEFGEE